MGAVAKGGKMATRAERTLEKHGKNVVSIKDKIKEFHELLRKEEEKEREAKNFALVELVNNMNLSYSDIKEAVNMIKSQFGEPAPATPDIPDEPPAEIVPLEPDPAEESDINLEKSRKLKEKSDHENEIY
jgi:hypothetical protein